MKRTAIVRDRHDRDRGPREPGDAPGRIEAEGDRDVARARYRVTQSDGTVFTYFLDPDVFLEIKVIERRTIRGAEQETETDLGDYERVAGVYFPFSISSGPRNSADKQTITIESGEANVAIPADAFAMPAQPVAASQSK